MLGGATVTVFSTIAMTGMKLIASQDLTARNTTIVGLSAALGVGISQASAATSQFCQEPYTNASVRPRASTTDS